MGIKKNFVYNVILTLSSNIAALLIFPYVSRVLGVEYIGVFGFVNRTIDYFVLFSTLGISIIGVRGIAACKNDFNRRSEVFSNLVSISLILTIIVIGAYCIVVFSFPQLRIHKALFLIGISKLFFSTLLIEWFYQGIEKFKYISIRNIIIKIIYVISIFLFVKERNDYVMYFILTVSLVSANSLVNIFASRKYVSFKFTLTKVRAFLKPIATFGFYKILDSMYSTLNIIILGFLCPDKEVGYYYTANNLYYVLIGLLTAFTRVMLPRMTALHSEKKDIEFNILINKSFSVVFAFCIPVVIFGIILATSIIEIIAGNGFQGAVIPLRIMMILIFINGCAQIVVIQILTPLHKDKVILIGTIFATFVAILFNFILVKKYGAIGSSIILVISVFFANIYPFYYAIKNKLFAFPMKNFILNLIYSTPYVVLCLIPTMLFDNAILIVLTAGLSSFFYFIISHYYFLKSEFILGILKYVKSR